MCNHHDPTSRCLIPPHPALQARLKDDLERLRENAPDLAPLLHIGLPDRPGLNDGIIVPGDHFPAGTSLEVVRSTALERAPLRGSVRVVVVLVEFSDRQFDTRHGANHFEELFFSRGKVAEGSVREYFSEVSNGEIDVIGEVVGPYRLPRTLAEYANGASGTGAQEPNARTMARHAAEAANKDVDFKPYDNDGNGFVDAFIVVHAGAGGETTGSGGDIWSHKWVLANGEYNADGTRIYAYLTVPEDARIGVCCHELGHLLFGWPDLYDTDGSSEGLGNWCLMAGGSWNGGGDVPAHPSAWCKAQQGWVSVANQTQNGVLTVADVKDSRTVYRLWKDGAQGNEYFLVENRQQKQFDRLLPGGGLLVYHLDDAVASNADERHPKVALLQADGRPDLNQGRNRGDAGDPFPGSANNVALTGSTVPSTRSYNDVATGVALTQISAPGPVMTATVTVRSGSAAPRRRVRVPRVATTGSGREAVPQNVRDLVLALYEAVSDGPAQPAGEDHGWRNAVEARLAAVEHALSAQPDTVMVRGMPIVAARNGGGAYET
ncbi:M6 family metalloprotease domain-containing protein [Longimicrobium sp.]|uniref:M6 family metalloprotease domain-containing protein n=1 Tax=Longimicrobium sp. TaxID=2029185 RepID=UPI003B3A3316